MKARAGDVVFIRGKGPISSIIRLFDRGEFSHVAIFVSDTEIIEAEYSTRVRIVEFDYEDYEIVPMNFTAEEALEIRNVAELLLGRWYDYFYVFVLWLRLAFGKTLGDKYVNDPKKMICSELVAYILIHQGRGSEELLSYTPNELYSALCTLLPENRAGI